jgi:secondary thiamine-phosphate synthase enzyme
MKRNPHPRIMPAMRHVPPITERVDTRQRCQMLDVTHLVTRAVAAHKVTSGLAIVHIPHTTAAITINENADPDVKHDMLRKLEEMVPHQEPYYRHGEGNSDSHVKTSLVGNAVHVLIEDGKPLLGTWQGVQFCEFDGPRRREVVIKLVAWD